MRALCICIFMISVVGRAQPSLFDADGYLKYLSSVSWYPGVTGTLYDQLFHGRLSTGWYPSNSLRGAVEVQMRAYYGGSVQHAPQFLDQVRTSYDLTNLDAVLWNKGQTLGYAQIDRLWVDYSTDNFDLVAGRQRIAWGTALVWNVIDLYNPKSVLDFDYEEKPGTDAVRFQYYTGPVSKIELAAKPGETWRSATVAGSFAVNVDSYDYVVLAGVRRNRWVVGAAWAGSIFKGGFRGEILLTQAPNRPAASGVLSGDYTWSNSFYAHSEILYNTNGETRNAGLFRTAAMDEGMLSPARWSIYQEIAYDISPLTRATLFLILNPNDHSKVVVPMLSQSLNTNLDLLLLGLLSSGVQSSEFGEFGKSVYLRLKYSF